MVLAFRTLQGAPLAVSLDGGAPAQVHTVVLADRARPLVLYGLGFEAGGPLLLGQTADGFVQLSW